MSIAYAAAADRVLGDPLPTGMGLRVPHLDPKEYQPMQYGYGVQPHTPTPVPPAAGSDGLYDFDEMDIMEVSKPHNMVSATFSHQTLSQMRASIVEMIDTIPPARISQCLSLEFYSPSAADQGYKALLGKESPNRKAQAKIEGHGSLYSGWCLVGSPLVSLCSSLDHQLISIFNVGV